ncbi:MAG: hypothetical protein AB7F43_02535 [Bacteriovoracia bacterium]
MRRLSLLILFISFYVQAKDPSPLSVECEKKEVKAEILKNLQTSERLNRSIGFLPEDEIVTDILRLDPYRPTEPQEGVARLFNIQTAKAGFFELPIGFSKSEDGKRDRLFMLPQGVSFTEFDGPRDHLNVALPAVKWAQFKKVSDWFKKKYDVEFVAQPDSVGKFEYDHESGQVKLGQGVTLADFLFALRTIRKTSVQKATARKNITEKLTGTKQHLLADIDRLRAEIAVERAAIRFGRKQFDSHTIQLHLNVLEHEKRFLQESKEDSEAKEYLINEIDQVFKEFDKLKKLASYVARLESNLSWKRYNALAQKVSSGNFGSAKDYFFRLKQENDSRVFSLEQLGYRFEKDNVYVPDLNEILANYKKAFKGNPPLEPVRVFEKEGTVIPVRFGENPPVGAEPIKSLLSTPQFLELLSAGYFPMGEPVNALLLVSNFDHDLTHLGAFMAMPEYGASLRNMATVLLALNKKASGSAFAKISPQVTEMAMYDATEGLVAVKPGKNAKAVSALDGLSKPKDENEFLDQIPKVSSIFNEDFQNLGGQSNDVGTIDLALLGPVEAFRKAIAEGEIKKEELNHLRGLIPLPELKLVHKLFLLRLHASLGMESDLGRGLLEEVKADLKQIASETMQQRLDAAISPLKKALQDLVEKGKDATH